MTNIQQRKSNYAPDGSTARDLKSRATEVSSSDSTSQSIIQQRKEEIRREIDNWESLIIRYKLEVPIPTNYINNAYDKISLLEAELKGIEFVEKEYKTNTNSENLVHKPSFDKGYSQGKAEAENCFKEMIENLVPFAELDEKRWNDLKEELSKSLEGEKNDNAN